VIVRDPKFKTAEAFFQSTSKNEGGASAVAGNESFEDIIEIGCKDCEKLRDRETKLVKDLE
jgi:hypothetical protein